MGTRAAGARAAKENEGASTTAEPRSRPVDGERAREPGRSRGLGNQATLRALGLATRRAPTTPARPPSLADPHEREADRVAEALVSAIDQPLERAPRGLAAGIRPLRGFGGGPVAQLKAEIGDAPARSVGAELQRARSGGRGLDQVSPRLVEAMGADLSSVRLHTDRRADALNQALGSRAFTSGSDIFFRAGHYQPATRSGTALIAHELTHVVQQRSAGHEAIQRKIGFEFQTCGAHNPKVLASAEDHHAFSYDHRQRVETAHEAELTALRDEEATDDYEPPTDFLYGYSWRDHGVSLGFSPPAGSAFEVDKGDVEIKTEGFDETPKGRTKMLKQVQACADYLCELYGARKERWIQLYRVRRNPDSVTLHQKAFVTRELTLNDEQSTDWVAIDWPKTEGSSALEYGAAMQATVGVRFEALGDLVAAAIESASREDAPRRPTFDDSGIFLGAKSLARSFRLNQFNRQEETRRYIAEELARVDQSVRDWLDKEVTDANERTLLGGLLRLLGVRFAHGWTAAHYTTLGVPKLIRYFPKDYAALMNRSALAEIYTQLQGLGLTDGFDAAAAEPEKVFGDKYTRSTKWMPKRTKTIGEYFDAIAEGTSELAATGDASMGILTGETELKSFDMERGTDIGVGYSDTSTKPTRRSGLVIELRQLGKGTVRVADWARAADAIFRAIVFLNSGKEITLEEGEYAETVDHPGEVHPVPRPPPRPPVAPVVVPAPVQQPGPQNPQQVGIAPLPLGVAPLPQPVGVAPLPNGVAPLPVGVAPQPQQAPLPQGGGPPQLRRGRGLHDLERDREAEHWIRMVLPPKIFANSGLRAEAIKQWKKRIKAGEFGDLGRCAKERFVGLQTRTLRQRLERAMKRHYT